MKYIVIEQHYGDKQYYRGDEREVALKEDVQQLKKHHLIADTDSEEAKAAIDDKAKKVTTFANAKPDEAKLAAEKAKADAEAAEKAKADAEAAEKAKADAEAAEKAKQKAATKKGKAETQKTTTAVDTTDPQD